MQKRWNRLITYCLGYLRKKNRKGALHPASPFAPAWVSDHPNHHGIMPSPNGFHLKPHPEAKLLNRNSCVVLALLMLKIRLANNSRQSLNVLWEIDYAVRVKGVVGAALTYVWR
jgi:hypothetical protein